ncbi:tRNA pseudouridine(38/39) synthase [Ranunculus cassubicifolius]
MVTMAKGEADPSSSLLDLQNQIKSLRDRVKEMKNLSITDHKVRTCPSKEVCKDASHEDAAEKSRDVGGTRKKKSRARSPGFMKTLHHIRTRYVALKIMYFGQRFFGFASVEAEPTIESEIFNALQKTRLLIHDKNESRYTRCGRTDRGVSSVGQVISLVLRSKPLPPRVHGDYEEVSPEDICEKIDYVKVINSELPKDIRVISWCPAPDDFHARFNCLGREYKYLFWRENLDLPAMQIACKKFVGEHDFRNFCKMDAANVHNYRRCIKSFEISSCNSSSEGEDQLWVMTIKGTAFLWHQIRCMVAVLFMIGQGLELPSVVDDLLDTTRTPRKPQYVMAPELPLILRTCKFDNLNFICSPDAGKLLQEDLSNEIKHYKLQAAIFQEALLGCSFPANDESVKKKVAHIPLLSRPTEPTYEERHARLNAKKLDWALNSYSVKHKEGLVQQTTDTI